MSEESRAMRAPNALRRPNKFIAYMRKYWFVYMLAFARSHFYDCV